MTSVRWDKKKKEALAHLFLDGAIQLDESSQSVHKKYAQIWGGIKLENFSKHFRDIKKTLYKDGKWPTHAKPEHITPQNRNGK